MFQEITLWRKGERLRKPHGQMSAANSVYQIPQAMARHEGGDMPSANIRTAPTPSEPNTPMGSSQYHPDGASVAAPLPGPGMSQVPGLGGISTIGQPVLEEKEEGEELPPERRDPDPVAAEEQQPAETSAPVTPPVAASPDPPLNSTPTTPAPSTAEPVKTESPPPRVEPSPPPAATNGSVQPKDDIVENVADKLSDVGLANESKAKEAAVASPDSPRQFMESPPPMDDSIGDAGEESPQEEDGLSNASEEDELDADGSPAKTKGKKAKAEPIPS